MKRSRYTVLISGMLIQLCAGIIYMWSVFKGPVSAHLSWDAAAAGYTSSIMLAAFVLGILIGGRAQDSLGPKKVTIAGSVLIGAGMSLTALVSPQMPWLLYLTYGILGGFGVGCVYTCTVAVVQKWFPDRRGFATGMIVGAFGFSLVIFSPSAKFLLDSIGVPLTFAVFAVAFLLICIPCATLINPPEPSELPAAKSSAAAVKKSYAPAEMVKTRQFLTLFLSMMFLLATYFIINPQLIDLAKQNGLEESLVTLPVMIIGIASASGRLLLSWLSDRIGRKSTMLIICVITLISALLLMIPGLPLFFVCIVGIAFAFGGSSGVYAAATADNFGTKHAGVNFGCVIIAFGLSALISPLIAAKIPGSAGSFIFAGCCAAVALACVMLYRPISAKAK